MTSADILSLSPGLPLDQAVSIYVMGESGKPLPYSTDEAHALKLLDRLNLFVGRVPADSPKQDPSRPFVAGTLGFDAASSGEVARLRVTAGTRMIALCKAALLVIFAPAKSGRESNRAPAPTPQPSTAARELAARVGTPAARGPIAAAARAAEKQRKAAAAKQPRGKVKIGGGVASAPVRTQHVPQNPPRRNQPGIFVHAGDKRQPMPKRTEEFKGPVPFQTVGTGAQPRHL